MTRIKCQIKTGAKAAGVKVKVIRAPLVDNLELRRVIYARARALVL